MHKAAEIRGTYRYSLSRVWDRSKQLVLFIGLNPSTADDKKDDHTITRCMRFAEGWGYGGILVGNLFAHRATNPKQLLKTKDPVGPENDEWLKKLSRQADKAIAVWGNGGTFLQRNEIICERLKDLYCLGLTKAGHPHHPRGLLRTCVPSRYNLNQILRASLAPLKE